MEKVLFLVWGIEFGGLEVVLLDWLSGIDYAKVSVVLGCRAPEIFSEKLAAKKLPVETIKLTIPEDEPFWKTLPQWLRTFSSIRPCKIVLLEGVLAQFDLMAVLAAWWSTRGRVFLFLGGWGGSLPDRSGSRAKRNLRDRYQPGIGFYQFREILNHGFRARLVRNTLVASRALADNLITAFCYPRARISVLHHGVDTERFQASPADRIEFRRAHAIPDGATVIVSHGRLARVKRPDRILKAFARLCSEHSGLWLLMTDYGPWKEQVEKIVAGSDEYRRVKFIGFQDDVSTILKASDIYVMASENEGFGIALVEAMSTGLVCVSTHCGGPAEIILKGENGILVEVSDDGVLAGLSQALQLRPDERARMVEMARKTVESRFEIHIAIRSALSALRIPSRYR